jgi:hypothetical protein
VKEKPKTISRINILNYITMFSLGRDLGTLEGYAGLKESRFKRIEQIPTKLNCLVALTSAPISKWYLSWLIDYKQRKGYIQYLLESVEDGDLCWWGNVSLWEYPPAEKHPEWQWTDEQHKFNKKWLSVKKKEKKYTLKVPMQAIFDENDVILSVREKFDEFKKVKQKYFINWKKIKLRDMIEWFNSVEI